MRQRGTLVLLAAVLALAGYVWLVEIRGAEEKAAEEAASHVFFSLDPAGVTGLELDSSDGPTLTLERAGADSATPGWRLAAPVAYPADADAVDRALRALEKLTSTAMFEVRPDDLEPFGLGASRKRVTVKSGAGEPRTLHLGGKTPVGDGRYVELADDKNRLYAVSAGSLVGLTPTLVELRDKRILRVLAGEVDELTLRAGGALVVRAKKTEAGWALVEPEAAPADSEKIRRVLDDLALARASGFEDSPGPRASYGLESPKIEVAVRAGPAEERLGLADVGGKHWLERAGDPVILEVNERVGSNLPLAFFDYRAKRVQTLDVEQVHALELTFPREGQKRKLIRDGEVWKSEAGGPELKPLAVEDLVYAIAALDATGLESESPDRTRIGLDPALATIRSYDEKGALLGELSFGDPHPDRGLPVLSSSSPLVWRVANEIGREVPLSPEAFTNLLVQAAPAAAPNAEPDAPASP